ncbi:unnamed protein product [Heligmosomoides polygyrus]|uniref:C2H2-type domain-containing protein n=1 Tax=Heligmosomoides polygyrus TaxID=6339 RepID=A0A3P8CPB5_HELPZ|nr:unnamed protein product [Heligmosomoides polygyrus]
MDISPELCPACDTGFETVTDLLVHAIEFHDFSGTVKQEVFPSYCAFERWKDEMEEEHNSCWLQRDEETLHMVFHGHLRCHRSRRIMKRKRKISELVLKSCTSFMDVKRYLTTGVTSVEYCLEHFGHKQLPQKPRLRWSVKMEIVEMLKLGLPIAEIVRIIRNENDGALERQYVVTVQDVKRIANKLRDDPLMFVETGESADAEEGIKAEQNLAENSTSEASIKEEQDTMPTSAFKVEPDSEENFTSELIGIGHYQDNRRGGPPDLKRVMYSGNRWVGPPANWRDEDSPVSNNNNPCSRVRQVELNSNLQQVVESIVQAARVEEHRRNAIENLPESCPACDMRLKNVTDLLMHANEVHEFEGVVKEEVFPSFDAFESWKEVVNRKHNTCWIRKHERTDQMMFYRHLRCYRPRRTGEHTTNPSSGAVQNGCTAFMNVKRQITSDVTSVEYCLDHFGHEQEQGKPPLFESVKPEILDVLEQSVSVVKTARSRRKRNNGALAPEPSVTVDDMKRIIVKVDVESQMSETKESTSRKVRARTKLHGAESSVAEASIKEEPTSAMTWLAEPSSTRIELSPVEAKPPSDDGVRVFTLTAEPDGKGFALVDQPTCTDEAEQVL